MASRRSRRQTTRPSDVDPLIAYPLVVVGIACLVLEAKAPGLFVPFVIATTCFVLLFAHSGGPLVYLGVGLFLLGLALLGVEIFLIPGFGATGVSGILLVLAGLVLAGLDKAPESAGDWADVAGRFLGYCLATVGAGVGAFILSEHLPHMPFANRLILTPPGEDPEAEAEPPSPAEALLGQVGTTTSQLGLAGTARFGGRRVGVVADGELVPAGTPVRVVEVEGTRIVVKRV